MITRDQQSQLRRAVRELPARYLQLPFFISRRKIPDETMYQALLQARKKDSQDLDIHSDETIWQALVRGNVAPLELLYMELWGGSLDAD